MPLSSTGWRSATAAAGPTPRMWCRRYSSNTFRARPGATVTANKCKDLLRSAHRRRSVPLAEAPAPPGDPDEVYEVRAALEKLAPKQRSAVYLHYYEQLPTREIARAMGLSDAAVRSRLQQARKRLKELLGGEEDG